MELLSWIPPNKLSHILLNSNPNSYDYITSSERHIVKDWITLSGNTGALPLLLKNKHKINLNILLTNKNPAAVPLIKSILTPSNIILYNSILQSNPNTFQLSQMWNINWPLLCANTHPSAIQIIENSLIWGNDEIDWSILSANPAAIKILEDNQDRINWNILSSNPAAMNLILKTGKINYMHLCKNTHPLAIEIIKTLPKDQIHWIYLSYNPAAIEFLEENQEAKKCLTMVRGENNGNTYLSSHHILVLDQSNLL
jgi:hypothetical protein